MVGHEIFGLLGVIVAGAIVLGAINNGTQTAQVLNASFSGFSNLLHSMQGYAPASGTAQAPNG